MNSSFKTVRISKSWIANDMSTEAIKLINVEKIIDDNNILPISFLKKGLQIANSVCLLKYTSQGETYAATGFMISPNLCMTNYHVFENKESAGAARAVFKYEVDRDGMNVDPEIFEVAPEKFFYSNKGLDLAIVAIDEKPGSKFGYIRLLKSNEKVKVYERVNIIHHPIGGKKSISFHDNMVTQIFEKKLHYRADTMKGSSGAAVLNNNWELVALHHAGYPSYNEGIRVSSICKHLVDTIKEGQNEIGKASLITELLEHIF